MPTEYSKQLVERYLNGTATEKERAIIESWYTQRTLLNSDASLEIDYHSLDLELRKRLLITPTKKIGLTFTRFGIATAAAIIVAVFGIWLYVYDPYAPHMEEARQAVLTDIPPGRPGATLTLTNGKIIELRGDKAGLIVANNLKYNDGSLVTDQPNVSTEKPQDELTSELIASTSTGQTYQLTLPDGTQVWLNAGSSIRFPASFKGKKERIVELSGEAYFSVVHNDRQTFLVKSEGQFVEDVGTQFNISAYPDEGSIRTTLVEGIARIYKSDGNGHRHKSLMLSPNQQAVLLDGSIQVNTVNVAEVVAWKNGMFRFDHADIKTIMNQISRWYNVEIRYQGEIPIELFKGKVPRNVNLSQVIKILTASGINLKLEGKVIFVK